MVKTDAGGRYTEGLTKALEDAEYPLGGIYKMLKKLKIILFCFLFFLSNVAFINAYEEKPVHMRTTAPYQKFINTSFSIKKKINNNKYLPHASGFYLEYDGVPYGITARHVVQVRNVNEKKEVIWGKDIKPLYIRIHTDDSVPLESRHKELSALNNSEYEGLYIFHNNASIDAAIFPAFFLSNLSEVSFPIPYKYIQKDELVLVGEDVHVFGFPGPYGFAEGKSIIRSGTICFKLNQYLYILDANTWPGDSGGMVVSKPYFGVLKENTSSYQWQFGGKIIGLYIGRKNPTEFKDFNLPESLEAFRSVVSGQALIEIIESDKFKEYHKKWKNLWVKIKKAQVGNQPPN